MPQLPSLATNKPVSVLAIDVGAQRIGVARAILAVRFARPLTTLSNPATFETDIADLIQREEAGALVIGLPRGLDGQETAQTRTVQAFGARLATVVDVPIYWMDEAVTSAQAEAELQAQGKPYQKGDIDALAATYILEDYLREHKEGLDV